MNQVQGSKKKHNQNAKFEEKKRKRYKTPIHLKTRNSKIIYASSSRLQAHSTLLGGLLHSRLAPLVAGRQPTRSSQITQRQAATVLKSHRVVRLLEGAEEGPVTGVGAPGRLYRQAAGRLRNKIALGDRGGREDTLRNGGGGGGGEGGDTLGVVLGEGAGHAADAHGGLKSSRSQCEVVRRQWLKLTGGIRGCVCECLGSEGFVSDDLPGLVWEDERRRGSCLLEVFKLVYAL
jgi:hypothetical protein